jgi:hypothetical protein
MYEKEVQEMGSTTPEFDSPIRTSSSQETTIRMPFDVQNAFRTFRAMDCYFLAASERRKVPESE